MIPLPSFRPACRAAALAVLALASALAAAAAPTASEQLRDLLRESDEGDLRLSPIAGIGRGDARYMDQFGDYITDEFMAESEAKVRAELRRLARIDRGALPPKDRIAYDVFRYTNEFALRGFEQGIARINQKLPIDHLQGLHMGFADLSSGQGLAPYRTVADYENGLKRFPGFTLFLTRAQAMMRAGMKSGHVQPRIVTTNVIGQLDGLLKGGVEGSPFFGPVKKFPDEVPESERPRLLAAYRAAIADQILPALTELRRFMREEYLPASRATSPGVGAMPGGKAYYEYLVEQHTTVRMGAGEIYRLGVAEVERIGREMDRIKDRVGFKGTRKEFFEFQRTAPQFKFPTREAFLGRYEEIRRRMEPGVARLFAVTPKSALEVRPVPEFQEASQGGAYYIVGTTDGKRPGVFYANTYDLPSRTAPRMEALFLHEGIPGHHFQVSLAQEDETLPPQQRFGGNAGYVEGWALYCERLGPELGLYQDPYAAFGALDMDMLRAMRLVVDPGLHAMGWSRERAIQYLRDHSSLGETDIAREVDRYIAWPGQAVSYKLGQTVILRLRARAEKELGARWDVRAFHDEVLNTGSLPLAVLEAKIGAWIAGQKVGAISLGESSPARWMAQGPDDSTTPPEAP